MKKGFTLIELLIVIAILGILVALILPRFSDIREDANTKVCVANLRGLVSAMATYETRYNTTIAWGTTVDTVTYDVDFIVGEGFLSTNPYCPTDAGATKTNYTIGGSGGNPTAACPFVGANATHVWPAAG